MRYKLHSLIIVVFITFFLFSLPFSSCGGSEKKEPPEIAFQRDRANRRGEEVSDIELQRRATKMHMTSILGALIEFRMDIGRYPTTEEGLKALRENPDRKNSLWCGPYLKNADDTLDYWKNEIIYNQKEGGIEIRSKGQDGKENTGDDICRPVD